MRLLGLVLLLFGAGMMLSVLLYPSNVILGGGCIAGLTGFLVLRHFTVDDTSLTGSEHWH